MLVNNLISLAKASKAVRLLPKKWLRQPSLTTVAATVAAARDVIAMARMTILKAAAAVAKIKTKKVAAAAVTVTNNSPS